MAARRISSMFTSSSSSEKPSTALSIPPPASRPRDSSSHVPRRSLPNASHSTTSSSLHSREPSLPTLLDPRSEYQAAGTPGPLLPLPTFTEGSFMGPASADHGSRPSTPGNYTYSRPTTPSLTVPGLCSSAPISPASVGKQKLKKGTALFGGKKKDTDQTKQPIAWVAGHPQRLPYEVHALVSARPELELCDQVSGDCFVHLWPKSAGRGASFKVDSAVFAASPVLTRWAFGDSHGPSSAAASRHETRTSLESRTQRLSLEDPSILPVMPHRHAKNPSSISSGRSRPRTSNLSDESRGVDLYLPLNISGDVSATDPRSITDEVQKLIDIRNFFAFLCGQSLIATERKHSFFDIFMSVSHLLKTYEFSNSDGSTFGVVANDSFAMYVDELQLADVRLSREQTIEGIVLGERMKSVLLYNEAFTHGVGKYNELAALKSVKFELISRVTQNRLVIAARDLDKRTAAIREILTEFNFPSLFSGIMHSKMSEERKEGVRFEAWKEAFLGTRKYFASLLQQRYGHWPPKAKSKKNDLETSGLNRVVLVELYRDLSSLYDLLVDRRSLTTRTVNGLDLDGAREESMIRALRTVLSEYDHSSPPVKPPVPFDTPSLPTLKTTRPLSRTGDKKLDAKAASKKLKDDEILKILRASWDPDVLTTPFIDAFRDMELRAAHGCNISEMQDLRMGQWIFMYVVLQALPMLAVDALDIKHTQGVEYFLCAPPRNGVPWAQATSGGRIPLVSGDGSAPVSLPADLAEHGVEGIYRRSHCWLMAEQWTAANPIFNAARLEHEAISHAGISEHPAAVNTTHLSPFPTPAPANIGSLDPSPFLGNSSRPSSRPVTPVHNVDASRTFDAILADVGGAAQGAGKTKGAKKGGKK